jgi:hypothetical protein
MKREFTHLTPVERSAPQIIDRLDSLGSQTSKRALELSMSAHKRPLWREARALLIQRQCIRLTAGKRRQQIVQLLENPRWSQPRPIAKKPKRKRPRSEWFRFWLPAFLIRNGYLDQAPEANAELEQDGLGTSDQADSMARKRRPIVGQGYGGRSDCGFLRKGWLDPPNVSQGPFVRISTGIDSVAQSTPVMPTAVRLPGSKPMKATSTTCRLYAQVGFRREIAFVDPGAVLITYVVKLPTRRLLHTKRGTLRTWGRSL